MTTRQAEPYDHLFKLLLVGDAAVGKSRLVKIELGNLVVQIKTQQQNTPSDNRITRRSSNCCFISFRHPTAATTSSSCSKSSGLRQIALQGCTAFGKPGGGGGGLA